MTSEQNRREEAVTLMMETAANFFDGTLLEAITDNPQESAQVRIMMYDIYDALLAKGIINVQ